MKYAKVKRTINPLVVNRVVWGALLVASGIYALVSGERILFIAFFVLISLPLVGYLLTVLFLRGLRIQQVVPETIIKNETGTLTVRLHNATPMPFGNIECVFYGDEHVISLLDSQTVFLAPFRSIVQEVPFVAKYRGRHLLGLGAVTAIDIGGLFKVKRKIKKMVEIIVLPEVVDMSAFPLSMNLMTQAHSRFDIRDEDYATISDIRPYIPTDSIKRVHWKLTAKRSEWLVKIFQSNALNRVCLILDSTQLSLRPREKYALEDRMVGMTLGLARFCLSKGMPIDFFVTEGFKVDARASAEFDAIYHATGDLYFDPSPPLDVLSIFSHMLNEATGYVNVVIITGRLTAELYEKMLNASNNGHYIAVLYFATSTPDYDSERICKLLQEGGAPCYRVVEGENPVGI